MWQTRQCYLSIEFITVTFAPSFHSASSSSGGPSEHESTCARRQRSPHHCSSLVCFFFFFRHPVLCVYLCPPMTSAGSAYLCLSIYKSGAEIIDSPPHPPSQPPTPVTFCGICSQDVLISFGAPNTSYLAGSLTCKGIFHLDSASECSTPAITWPTLA